MWHFPLVPIICCCQWMLLAFLLGINLNVSQKANPSIEKQRHQFRACDEDPFSPTEAVSVAGMD